MAKFIVEVDYNYLVEVEASTEEDAKASVNSGHVDLQKDGTFRTSTVKSINVL